MLNQNQIDLLTAQEYSHFLSDEEEFCNENPQIADDRALHLYTNEHLDCLGDLYAFSDGGQNWIGSLDSTMSQDMTFGLQTQRCISTAVC